MFGLPVLTNLLEGFEFGSDRIFSNLRFEGGGGVILKSD